MYFQIVELNCHQFKVIKEQKVPVTSHVYPINGSDDSSSDESDFEDDIPLKIVQEGLKIMSGECPISGKTRISNCHNFSSCYDWMNLNKKLIKCTTWERLQAIVKKEMDQLPSLPDCFTGNMAVDGDQVDTAANKDIPSDIVQRFNVHYPIQVNR